MKLCIIFAFSIMMTLVISASLYGQSSMLDKTFGTNGTMTTFIAGGDSDYDEGYSSAIQTDGKIVIAGWSTDSSANYAFAVARLNANGTLDSTFGTNGTARTFISGGDSTNDKAYSLGIQTDGKIVLAGFSPDTTGGTEHIAFALARFNSNGTKDNTFGTNGTVRAFIGNGLDGFGYPIYAEGNSVAIQQNGKIVVGGTYVDPFSGYGFAVARLSPNGTLDNTFGTNGTTTFSITGESYTLDHGNSIAIQSDGGVVIAGSSLDDAGHYAFAVARLDSNGTLDNTFGSGGKATTFINGGGNDDEGYAVALQRDGKIVLSGFSLDTNSAFGNSAFAVARLNSNGTIDGTFGANGTVRAYINGSDSINDKAYAIAVQTDGKIVVGGTSGFSMQSFALARFDSNGTMDTTFGTRGTLRTNTFSTGDQDLDDQVRSISIQADGKIVAAGYSQATFGPTAFAVARYLSSNITGIQHTQSVLKTFALFQNYPNPFNPSTTINYQLPMSSHVTLKVFDILGREVATLVNERENAGNYSMKFDGSKLASGVYFYRLTAGDFVGVKKLMMLK